MSVKLCCCLCCTPCVKEYKYLQNNSGECNEIYEITVKYFDPMLLMEHINPVCSKESSVLCQNCWIHIHDFHEFYQTVMKTRASLEQVNIEKSPLHIKVEEEQVTTVFNDDDDEDDDDDDDDDDDNDGGEEFLKFTNDLEDSNFSDDVEMSNEDDDEIPLNKLRKTQTSDNEISKKRYSLNIKENDKSLNTQIEKHKDSNKLGAECIGEGGKNLQRKVGKFKASVKEAGFHPALDKGTSYDKFIAEWKSQLECDICSETFPIFDLLKVHFKDKHNARGFVKCCDRKFDRRCSLVEHIRMHIDPEMHKCDICGKLSGSKYTLIHHKKTIHGECQTFKCNECPKIFKQKQNLKSHLLTHVTGNKDFKCKECDKAYVLEFQLKKHIKLVHTDNRICDQCGKTLHGIGALKNHLKEHAGIEKPKYPCDECGTELGSRIALKRHKASYHNDGSTVYVCSLCGKVSSTERALKNHKKYVHEIERKYKCTYCDKAFKRSQNLQEHIATHTGESLYQCPQCPRSFKINSKYHEHRKKAHPVEWEEGRKNRLEKQTIDYERVTNQVVI